MNKKQKEDLQKRIMSVKETIDILKHQESNLLEALCLHSYDHNEAVMKQWVQEIFIGCEYIIRLEESLKLLKETMKPRRPRGGKKD